MVITESEQAVLRVERYLHPHPMVQRKMETLWLKSQGVDDKTILRLASISRATLFRYYNDYRESGAEKRKEVNFHQPKSKLEEYRSSLEEHFFKNPPATVKQARDFDTFKQAISSCLLHTHDQHKKQLDTLLTLKFQRFDPEAMCG